MKLLVMSLLSLFYLPQWNSQFKWLSCCVSVVLTKLFFLPRVPLPNHGLHTTNTCSSKWTDPQTETKVGGEETKTRSSCKYNTRDVNHFKIVHFFFTLNLGYSGRDSWTFITSTFCVKGTKAVYQGVIVDPFAEVCVKQISQQGDRTGQGFDVLTMCNVSITIFILNLKWIEMTFQFPSSKVFKKTLPGSCICTFRCLPCMHEDY